MLNFAQALVALQEGSKISRSIWRDAWEHVWLKQVTFNGYEPCLVQYNQDRDTMAIRRFPGALMDYDDITANDWEVIP